MRHGRRGTYGAGGRSKKLLLVHIGPHLSGHGPMEKGIGGIKAIYDGEVVFSDEMMHLDV